MKQLGLFFILALATSLVGYGQGDSSRMGGSRQSTLSKPATVVQKKEVEFPSLEDRLRILLVGTIAVGGMAILLNQKRIRADRLTDGPS